MTSEIKAGYVVMVVRSTPCCKNPQSIGNVFQVKSIEKQKCRCVPCGKYKTYLFAYFNGIYGQPVCRLKKISPRPELESIQTKDEVNA